MEMMPVAIEFTDRDQRPVYREMYRDLTKRLMQLAKHNSRILTSLMTQQEGFRWDAAQVSLSLARSALTPWHTHTHISLSLFSAHPLTRTQVAALYDAWLKTMIENSPTLNEVKRYQDPEVDDQTTSFRININAAIFVELSRMHFILHYQQLSTEHKALLDMNSVPTRDEQKRILSLWSLNLTESQLWTEIPLPEEIDWDTPVIKYSQKEVMSAVSMLCEVMNDLGSVSKPACSAQCPYEESAREFMEYFRALFTRNAVFACQASCLASTLNVPSMRTPIGEGEEEDEEEDAEEEEEEDADTPYRPSFNYFVWCSFYFGAIMRRIYYWESIKNNVIRPRIVPKEEELDRCRETIALIAEQLGEEAYEDCYATTCDEAYSIPGDEEWFAYRYPTKQPALGNILYELRPALRDRYWKEAHVTLETVLAASQQPRPRYFMRTSHLFVINVLDAYLRTINVAWRNAAVVSQEGIELSAWKLSRPTAPVLLQVFSRWWVYHDLFYQPCDDIYEALVVWFRILRTHFDDELFGTSMIDIANRILV